MNSMSMNLREQLFDFQQQFGVIKLGGAKKLPRAALMKAISSNIIPIKV